MINRRGFLGRLIGLLGLAALPVHWDTTIQPTEFEFVEMKKGTITELPNGWAVTPMETIPGRGLRAYFCELA